MNIYAFLITSLAGLTTFIGYSIIWAKGELNKLISSALGFSAGVMFFVSIFDLLPLSLSYFETSFFHGFHVIFWLLFFLVGIVLSTYVNRRIEGKIGEGSSLYKIGILSMIAIVIHNIPEGIITYLTTSIEYKAGLFLAFSIACHNIPEGICIAAPIYHATGSKSKAFLAVLFSALSEPIGAVIAYLFFQNNMSHMFIAILLSIVAGIMISLVFIEILPEAFKNDKKNTIVYFSSSLIAMSIAHLLF